MKKSLLIFVFCAAFLCTSVLSVFCAENKPDLLDSELEHAVSASSKKDDKIHQAEAPSVQPDDFLQAKKDDVLIIDVETSDEDEFDNAFDGAKRKRPYKGWRLTENSSLENTNQFEIATFDGRTASIIVDNYFTSESQLKPIEKALDAVWKIPGMQSNKAAVYVENESKFRFVLFPASFVYKDIELCDYLPSGIAFSYDSSLVYDVALKVGDLLPRVTGAFVSEKDFAELLYRAATLPDLYVNDADLTARVERLEKALLALAPKALYSRPYEIDPDLIQKVKILYRENNNITKKEIIAQLKQQKVKYSQSDIDTICIVLLGIYE